MRLNKTYLEIDMEIDPKFRITVGRAPIATSTRLSNFSGTLLSTLLKYEREFGKAGHISIWEEVYNGLGETNKRIFEKRNKPIRGKNIYDLPFEKCIGAELPLLVLNAKQEIDKSTIKWMGKYINEKTKQERDKDQSLCEIIQEVFTPDELFEEIIHKIGSVLNINFPGMSPKISYLRPTSEDTLEFKFATFDCKSKNQGIKIDKNKRATASLAWSNLEPVFIENTRKELSKKNPCFVKFYDDEDFEQLASLACLPVFAKLDGEQVFYGVMCIGSSSANFFKPKNKNLITAALIPLLTEMVLAEQFSKLIDMFKKNVVQKKRVKVKREKPIITNSIANQSEMNFVLINSNTFPEFKKEFVLLQNAIEYQVICEQLELMKQNWMDTISKRERK